MQRRAQFVRRLIFAALIALVIIIVAVAVGSTEASISSAIRGDSAARTIIFEIRLPRALLAAIVGAILAISGSSFQTVLSNALADPFILGVSGGAAAAAAVATAAGFAGVPGAIPLAAFAGASGATLLVFAMAKRKRGMDSARLLLSGLVLNAFFSAVILIALSFARTSDLQAALRWIMGSVGGATWSEVAFAAVSLVIASAALLWIANDLRMLAFGEDDARAKGIDVDRVKWVAFFAASLATGAAVAVCGIIGFVGLIVPQGLRMLWRYDYRFLMPVAAIAGAALLVSADLLSRTVIAPEEIPIGAVTALLGVPFFLLVLRKTA